MVLKKQERISLNQNKYLILQTSMIFQHTNQHQLHGKEEEP
jgi:hypothetical protein